MVQRRKGTKSSARRRKTVRKQKAGGWTDNLKNMLYPGGPEHKMYSGPGYDCPGVPVRPGHISGPGGPPGLPGLSLRGGGHGMGALGAGAFTTGATQELKQMGGRRRKTQRRQQRGGRYGFFPEIGPLNATNGVGLASYPPQLRIPCETGTHNALNPNPNNVQGLSTAVGNMPGWTPMGPGAPVMRGGGKKQKRQQKKKGGSRKQQRKQRGGAVNGVFVGGVDSKAYYAPTAGYSNLPMMPPVANNPGILMQTGYPARAFNQACMATH
jgi:hypothetical protein